MTESIEQPGQPESPIEWILAFDALNLVQRQFGGRLSAKSALADLLRDGLLRAKAEQIWESNEPTMNAAWKNRDEADAEEDVEIETSVWNDSRYWSEDLDLWRWPKNRFVVTARKRPALRTLLVGVRFAACDLESVLQHTEGSNDTSPRRGKGGRPPKTDAWTSFWCELIEIAQDGRLNIGNFESQAALRDTLLAQMGSGGLSEDSIKPHVSRVWNRFVEPPAHHNR